MNKINKRNKIHNPSKKNISVANSLFTEFSPREQTVNNGKPLYPLSTSVCSFGSPEHRAHARGQGSSGEVKDGSEDAPASDRKRGIALTSPPIRTFAALRCLLASWCADTTGLAPGQGVWLLRQLVDPAWHPTLTERERLAHGFLAWAEHRGIYEIALKALEETTP